MGSFFVQYTKQLFVLYGWKPRLVYPLGFAEGARRLLCRERATVGETAPGRVAVLPIVVCVYWLSCPSFPTGRQSPLPVFVCIRTQ